MSAPEARSQADGRQGRRARRARLLPDIDPLRCTGCGRCISACAPHVLVLERRGWDKVSSLVDAAACTGCHHCAWRCPFEAITMRPPARATP